jgi:CdiI immunity protein
MDAGRFPGFADMYSSYFHQDWRLDDSSAADVVKRYRRVQPQDEADHLRDELARLLASHPSEETLRAELGPFINYDPAEDGSSVQAWTERLLDLLDSPVE